MPATELAGRKVTARMDSIRIGYVSIFGHDCDVEYVPMESGFVVNIPYGDSSEDKKYQITRDTVRQWVQDRRLQELDDKTYCSIMTMNDVLADVYGDHGESERGKEESEIYNAVQKSKSEVKDSPTIAVIDELISSKFDDMDSLTHLK